MLADGSLGRPWIATAETTAIDEDKTGHPSWSIEIGLQDYPTPQAVSDENRRRLAQSLDENADVGAVGLDITVRRIAIRRTMTAQIARHDTLARAKDIDLLPPVVVGTGKAVYEDQRRSAFPLSLIKKSRSLPF
jgi:hypothetical protein